MGWRWVFPALALAAIIAVTYAATVFINAPTYAPGTDVVRMTDSTEIAVLRAQLVEIRSANEKLLTIVVWTLGLVAAVTTIFISFNYSQYRHVAERERASDKRDLSDELSASLKAQVKELSSTVDQQAERRLKQIQIDVKQAELQRIMGQSFVSLLGALSALRVARDIRELEEAQYPESVRYRLSDPTTSQILDRIESILVEPDDFGVAPDSWELNELDSEVAALPDKYAASKQRILALIRDPQRQATRRRPARKPRPVPPVPVIISDLEPEKD